jgi:tRNA/rRNA methyltransferase
MKASIRNMWGRLPLTLADVQVMHGMLRQFARWKAGTSRPHDTDKIDGSEG